MTPPLIDPISQTIAVGITVCVVAGVATLYLWAEDRRQRFLLFWTVAWLVGAARWTMHYAGLHDPAIRLVEALLGSVMLSLIFLGAYDILPRKRWTLDSLAWMLAVAFTAAIVAGAVLDRIYPLFYTIVTVFGMTVAWCFWRGYRATGIGGYGIASAALAVQGTFFGVALYLWGAEVSNMVLGPLLNIATAASFLLIAYQRSQRQMHDAERKLRKIFDTVPIPIVITRLPNGVIEQFNQATLNMTGLQAHQLTGKTAIEAGVVADPEKRQAIYDALISGLTVEQREIAFLHRGMERRTYAVNASRLDMDDGPRFIFALYDLSELRRIQNDLEKLNASLETQVAERTRDLEAFGSSVSHDLRAPLRHISAYISILQDNMGSTLEGENRELMDGVKSTVARMSTLIDDLLRFSRLGGAALNKQPCDLNAVVTEVIARLEPEAAGREIIWCVAQLPRIEADPSLLQQVLWNLISNAIKYTRPCKYAEIEFGYVTPDATGEHVFFVRDNGVGFDSKNAAKLFNVFQRLHLESEFEGTGVGLAIVECIIRKHGGRIWAESAVGKGATFYFTLGPTQRKQPGSVPAVAR